MINLDSKDIMDSKEAAERWGKAEDYVRQMYRKYPDKFLLARSENLVNKLS